MNRFERDSGSAATRNLVRRKPLPVVFPEIRKSFLTSDAFLVLSVFGRCCHFRKIVRPNGAAALLKL